MKLNFINEQEMTMNVKSLADRLKKEIEYSEIAKDLLKRLKKRLSREGVEGVKLVVYGSRVRGDYRWASDLDVLVLVKNDKISRKIRNVVNDEAFEISWKFQIPVSVMVYTEKDFIEEKTPFLKEVKSYGRIFE